MRNLETSVYSLDGNSIFDVSLKFERLGLQEINKFPETIFQGQDLNNSRDAFNYKMQFDKLFSLVKEFYVKINGVENMMINEDVEDEFERIIIRERKLKTVRDANNRFIKEVMKEVEGMKFQEAIDKLKNKLNRILSSNDTATLKYAKLDMIPDALNSIYTFLEDNNGNLDVDNAIETFVYEREEDDTIDDILKAIENAYNERRNELKNEIILSLKDRPEVRRQADISNTLKLTRYEGSASNVLRDILLTTNTILQDINNKRVELQETIRQDERLVRTIKEDNMLIDRYLTELSGMKEVEKNYLEPYNKVINNIDKINIFVNDL